MLGVNALCGGGAIGLWTPASISTALWLDASDSSTITLTSSRVSQWNDKSGNGRHAAQSNSSRQPTVSSADLNGRDVITFSADRLDVPTSLNAAVGGVSAYTLCSVYKLLATNPSVPSGQRIIQVENSTTGDSGVIMTYGGVSNHVMTDGALDNSAFQFASRTDVSTNWHNDSTEYIGGTSLKVYANGNLEGTDSSVGSTLVTPATNSITAIGATGHATNYRYLNGNIAEIVLVLGSVADRRKIEGYLAHKWGLTSSLPSNHPYKTGAPTL